MTSVFSFQALSFGKSVLQEVSLAKQTRELSSTDKKDCTDSKRKKEMSQKKKTDELKKQNQRAYIPLIPDGAGETMVQ